MQNIPISTKSQDKEKSICLSLGGKRILSKISRDFGFYSQISNICLMKKFIYLLSLVGIDQYSKYWAMNSLEIPRKITDFFTLRFVENSGIAFSIPIPRIFLLLLISAIVLYLVYYLWKTKLSNLAEISVVLITAGAIGNLIDRFLNNGAVIDFLSFWDFPIFNFADIFITCGVVIYLFMEIFSVPKTE
jgi:signal peptidase II